MSKKLTTEEEEKLVSELIEKMYQICEIFEKYNVSNGVALNSIAFLVALTLRPPKAAQDYFVKEFTKSLVEAMKNISEGMPTAKNIVINGKD